MFDRTAGRPIRVIAQTIRGEPTKMPEASSRAARTGSSREPIARLRCGPSPARSSVFPRDLRGRALISLGSAVDTMVAAH